MEYPFKDLLPLDEVLEREGYYKDWTHLDPKVFYSLTQISEYIKTKGFGVDVRLLIAQLAEHFGLKTTQINETEQFFKDIMQELAKDKEFYSLPEIVGARGGFDTLGERLNQTVNKTDGLSINQFSEEDRAVLQGLDPGHINAVLGVGNVKTENIDDDQVTLDKIDKSLRTNYVVPEDSEPGKIQAGLGTVDSPYVVYSSTNVTISNFIPCQSGEVWTLSISDVSAPVYFYDNDGNTISHLGGGKSDGLPYTFTVPNNPVITQFRINMRTSIVPLNKYRIAKGSSLQGVGKAKIEWLEIDSSNIVDNQVTQDKIDKSIPTNYVIPEDSEHGKLQAGAGTVGSPFVVRTTSSTTTLSNFVPCQPGEVWTLSISDVGAPVYFYDNDGNPIEYLGDGKPDDLPYTFTVPYNPDITQFRVNMRTSIVPLNEYVIVKGSSLPSFEKAKIEWLEIDNSNLSDNFEFPDKNIGGHATSRFTNKNLLVTGDSITEKNFRANKNWHDYLKDWLDLGTIYNDGKSGSGLVKNTGIVYRLPDWETKHGTESDVDFILLMGNMNDGTSTTTGDWSWLYGDNDVHKGDFTTIITDDNKADSMWYALRYTIETIIEKYPNTPFGYITSQPRSMTATKSGTPREGYDTSCWGRTSWFEEWVDAIIEVCGHYSVPVLDLYHESNLRPWIDENNQKYFSSSQDPLGDGIHPNSLGQELMAQKITEFVKQYM